MSSVISTQFESLSNEILLDIFEYLDAYQMYEAWYGLNARINSLLHSAQLFILHDQSMVDKNKWNWDALRSFYKSSQIRILSCSGNVKIDKRIFTDPMENLCTIILNDMTVISIEKVCNQISHENQIKCLSARAIARASGADMTQSFSHCILVGHSGRFLSLTHLSLKCPWYDEFPAMSVVFPQLRYLSLVNFQFSHNLLQSLQTNMPSLRSLKFQVAYYTLIPSPVPVKHVHELSINIHASSDTRLLIGVLSNFPCLRRLHIQSEYRPRYIILNGAICQQLIERYLPQLKQLTIDFNPSADEEILSTFYKSEFWLNKKVKATMSMNPAECRYPVIKTISVGREWRFRYFDNLQHT